MKSRPIGGSLHVNATPGREDRPPASGLPLTYSMRRKILKSKGVVGFGLLGFLASGGAVGAPPSGQALFKDNCSACHQLSGQGIPGAFPPLKGSPTLLGKPETVATTVLNGRGVMPAFKDVLNDPSLAAILTYARSAWGNHASPISAETLTKARKGTVQMPGKLLAH